jgi:hypothetical protein
MRARIRQVTDSVHGALDRVGQWFDPPLRSDARPLEMREAVLEHVEARVEPVGRGRRVLAFNRVSVTVLAEDKEQRAAVDVALTGIHDAIRARLGEIRCEEPPGFEVHVEYVKRAKPGWAADQRLAVAFESSSVSPDSTGEGEDVPALHLSIVRGTAMQSAYTLTERHIRIGRTGDPVDDLGRPRHNDVVFVEDGDEDSLTVGRAHASIRYQAERRQYRLFDDGSHNGTRVVRGGVVLDITSGDPVGVALASGDEIRFGRAAVRVRLESVGATYAHLVRPTALR